MLDIWCIKKFLEAFQCLCCGLKRYVHSLICCWKVGTIQGQEVDWVCTDFEEKMIQPVKILWCGQHFMLFNSLPQRALCMHYCLTFTKRLLLLQLVSMVLVDRGKQMNDSNQGIFLLATTFDQALFAVAKLGQWKWTRCVR